MDKKNNFSRLNNQVQHKVIFIEKIIFYLSLYLTIRFYTLETWSEHATFKAIVKNTRLNILTCKQKKLYSESSRMYEYNTFKSSFI